MSERRQRANALGSSGEDAVAEILRERGWDVKPGPIGGADLIIDGYVTVEVKTAKLSRRTDRSRKRWQFSLYNPVASQQPIDEDLVILRCESEPPHHFVIPGMLLREQLKKVDITTEDPRKYEGRWAAFREAWQLADLVVSGLLYFNQISLDMEGKPYDRSSPI
jgi:hypothetical protein